MSAFVACRGLRFRLLPMIAIAFAITAPRFAFAEPVAAAPEIAAGEQITVHIDQARILRLPERTVTLVIGNPLIADAVVQPGGIAVVTAKSYGATNLVALGRNGQTLMEQSVQVVGPDDKTVVVYRGATRETYSCAHNCEQRITVGDTQQYFTGNLTQVGSLNTMAVQQQQQTQR